MIRDTACPKRDNPAEEGLYLITRAIMKGIYLHTYTYDRPRM